MIVALVSSITLTIPAVSIIGYADGWENTLFALNSFILCIFGFAVPIYLGYKEHRKESTSHSSSSSTEHSETKRSTRNVMGFRNHPKIAAVLSTSESLSFLEEYLVNIQDVSLSHMLLLWTNINKWKSLEV